MADTSTSELDLRAILGVLWRRKWSILLIVALTTGSALFFSYRRTAVYSSTAEVQVTPLTASQILTNPYWTRRTWTTRSTSCSRPRSRSWPTRRWRAGSGSGTLSVEVPTNTQILQIGYSHPDPEMAQEGAQAFANASSRTEPGSRSTRTRRPDRRSRRRSSSSDDLEVAQAALGPPRQGPPTRPWRPTRSIRSRSQLAGLNTRVASLVSPDITPGTLIHRPRSTPSSPDHRQDAAWLRRRTGARGGVRVHARADGRPDPRRGPARCRRRSAGSGRRAEGLGLAQADPDEARHDLGVRARPPKPTARFGRTCSSSRATPACGSSR